MTTDSPVGRSEPLADRARPASLRRMVGNATAIAELDAWASAWENAGPSAPRARAVLLEGPPGVGKTTAALAVAADRGWTVVELNASDARNAGAVERIAGRASLAHTLGDSGTYRASGSGGRTLILLDEADCLSGKRTEEATPKPTAVPFREFLRTRYGNVAALRRSWGLDGDDPPLVLQEWSDLPANPGRAAWARAPPVQADLADWRDAQRPKDTTDRGGLGAIAQLVRTTRQPLVLTVNDAQPLLRYSPVFRQGPVARIRFAWLAPAEIRGVLQATAAREGWTVGSDALETIVRRASGDLRAALNDLEALHLLPPGVHALGPLTGRDRTEEIETLVRETLSEGRFYRNVEVRERLDVPPDELFPWIEENVPRFAGTAAGLSAGLDRLARAELLLARARRYRVWGLWSFASEIMTGGVGIALAGSGGAAATRPFFPQFLMDMGRTRALRSVRDAVALKTGRFAHLSKRKAREEMLPFLERWATPRGSAAGMALSETRQRYLRRALDLSPPELAFLAGIDEGAVPTEPEEAAVPEPVAPEPPPTPQTGSAPEHKAGRRAQRRLGDFGG